MSDSTATELGRFPLRLTGANNAVAVLAVTPREFSSASVRRELVWNVLLVLVIVLVLIGVGVMAAAIPESS